MSYILDALRRADAERQRGQVPGLNALSAAPGAGAPAARSRTPLWATLAALGLAGAGLAGWWLLREPVGTPAGAVAVPAPTPVPAAATTTAQAPATAPVPAPASLPVVVSAPSPSPAPPAVATAPATAPAPTVAPPPQPVAAPAPVTAPTVPPAPAPARPAVAPEPRALALADLPPEQRRELPPMAVGGSIWSESPANRFVIINGQLVREGEAAAPGVTLERIGPKSAVLRWRELRVELPL